MNNTQNIPASLSDKALTTIAPWLNVINGAAAVTFYKAAFGATEIYHLDGPDGSVVSQLAVDNAIFWLSDASPDNPSPVLLGGGSVRMILTVADPDAVFAKAVQAGATVIFPVEEAHGWRLGRMSDPFGHHWEIGKMLDN